MVSRRFGHFKNMVNYRIHLYVVNDYFDVKEKIIPVTLEDLTIEERIVSAQLVGIRQEIINRQPNNMSVIKLLQGRHSLLIGEMKGIKTELDERWKQEIIK